MPIRALIFDCNGLIADDEPFHFEGLRVALTEAGIPITHQEYLDHFLAHDDRGAIETALRRAGRPAAPATRDAIAARKRQVYDERVARSLPIFPGVPAFARAAAARYATAIGSGALRHEIDRILAKAGIADCFPVIVSAEEVERCKPAPDCYLRVLDKIRASSRDGLASLRPAECLVLEDSRGGVTAAKEAGMRCAAVLNSYPAEQLAHADVVLPTLEGVTPEALVARLNG